MVYKNVKALEINTVLMHQATNLARRRIECAKEPESLKACNLLKENKIVLILYK